MKIIIFDTETTGLLNSGGPMDKQPYVCQFAAILYEYKKQELTKLAEHDLLIKPPIPIPESCTEVHGISDDTVAEKESFGHHAAFIAQLFKDADIAVAHNIDFDDRILQNEFLRLGLNKDFLPATTYDTMLETKELCQLKAGNFGERIKNPTLSELHLHLFGEEFANAHNALADVAATGRCLAELIRIKHYKPKKSKPQGEAKQISLF